MLRGKDPLLRMILMRRRHINDLDVGIRAQRCSAVVNPGRKFQSELLESLGSQIHGGHERNARITHKGWKHDGERAAKAQHPHAQFALRCAHPIALDSRMVPALCLDI